MASRPRPPLLARALVRLVLPSSVAASFEGDLEERFHRTAQISLWRARSDYWRDAVSPTLLRLRRESRSMPLPPGSGPVPGGRMNLVGLPSDLRFAARSLTRAPGFAAIAVFSLALGIGPNTAVFSLADSLFLRDWGVGNPDTLVDVWFVPTDGGLNYSYYSTYEFVRDGTEDVFQDVAS